MLPVCCSHGPRTELRSTNHVLENIEIVGNVLAGFTRMMEFRNLNVGWRNELCLSILLGWNWNNLMEMPSSGSENLGKRSRRARPRRRL